MPAPITTPLTPRRRDFSEYVADEPSLELALARAREFVAGILAHPWTGGYCLTFSGMSGTGKSLLCEMIMAELRLNAWGRCAAIERRYASGELKDFSARFFDMRKVSDGFKAGRYGIVEQMEEVSLAVLDDVGADHDPSSVTASKADRVLRSRRGKWTLVTVNLSLKEIKERLDGRIASFLVRDENRYVPIKAEDFAMRKLRTANQR